MDGRLSDSYTSRGPPFSFHKAKLVVSFSILLPLVWLLSNSPILTIIFGVISIGILTGYYAGSLRDAVVESGLAAIAGGVTLLIVSLFAGSDTGTSQLLLVTPLLLVVSTIVSLGSWYVDWYLTHRYGSSRTAVLKLVHRNSGPKSTPKTHITQTQFILIGLSLMVIITIAIGALFPATIYSIIQPAEPTDDGTGAESALPYAGVSVSSILSDTKTGVEVYVYSFGTADVVSITNVETGDVIELTPANAEGFISGSTSDTIVIEAVRGGTRAEIKRVSVS